MRVGMSINYAGGFAETVNELADYEKAGLGIVFVPEAYSFDAVSQLGYIAARTERLELASGILQLYSRTPTLTAMTAAGLDYVSGGRFVLGIGASGPQVIEGWHGVPYDSPVGRTREIIEICRAGWRRQRRRAGIRSSFSPRRRRPCGASRSRPAPRGAIPRSARWTWWRKPGWRSARTYPDIWSVGGQCWPCTSAGWGPEAATSTTTWRPDSAMRLRPPRSRTPTCPAARTRRPRWCPNRCWQARTRSARLSRLP